MKHSETEKNTILFTRSGTRKIKKNDPLLLRMHLCINFFLPESFLQLESHCISDQTSDIPSISLTVLDL